MEALPFRKESTANFSRVSRMEASPNRKESVAQVRRESRMEANLAKSRRMSMYHRFTRFGPGSFRGTESNAEGGGQTVRYENTYIAGPPVDKKKFNPIKVEPLLHDVLEAMLGGEQYDAIQSRRLSTLVSDMIKSKVKELGYPRYKYVCAVTIGENAEQGVQESSRCLWNTDSDRSVSVCYTNKSLFAIATVFAIYCE